jgi:hypothetical protein
VLFFSIYFNYAVHATGKMCCDAVVLICDFVCFSFPFILIMQSTPLTRVRCQCDAVVLIKIVILCAFLFSIYFNYAVHAPYTGECQCDAVVLIKIVILCAFLYFNYAVPLHG